jgi:hypothetical protein
MEKIAELFKAVRSKERKHKDFVEKVFEIRTDKIESLILLFEYLKKISFIWL